MARNLNIERRRKLIRHYQAMRRRRSPVRRAFTYWWGSALLSMLTLGVLALLVLGPWKHLHQGPAQRACWSLPEPGLTLRRASAREVAELRRQGAARRAAMALSDREVGISLAGKLPEPKRLGGNPLPELTLPFRWALRGLNPRRSCRLATPRRPRSRTAPCRWRRRCARPGMRQTSRAKLP